MYAYEAARYKGEPLSELEIKVLYLAATGMSVVYSAQALGYSVPSIKNYRQRVVAKLEARDITHAVFLATQKGIFDTNHDGKQPTLH